jgi:hypothetical protein
VFFVAQKLPKNLGMKMSVCKLTPSLISGLKPRKKIYTKRDKIIKGLYVRVMPSGRKSFALEFKNRDTVTGRYFTHHETLGDANKISLDEARKIAKRRIAVLTFGMAPPLPSEGTGEEKFAAVAGSDLRTLCPTVEALHPQDQRLLSQKPDLALLR